LDVFFLAVSGKIVAFVEMELREAADAAIDGLKRRAQQYSRAHHSVVRLQASFSPAEFTRFVSDSNPLGSTLAFCDVQGIGVNLATKSLKRIARLQAQRRVRTPLKFN
jgi:hypothetical protein